ncbi:hypothetical protein N473_23670 [Pseudoalteromonas luteoviolacea CPMOR-1]|uniref:Uncharacterized protein n=1 Tax=Pseudoalteromonas luteoviolacea CPMOR-1 TaxID=1365248 RepID=A0A161YIR1_9GAMM|nr:hypothetical protein [Pseudoalteromonas luteoviolacea]KZN61037.1 hypothetical protein N473_23670 [Pseudoalteromonas luteoviolacea CPMOR-1]
MPKIDEEQIKHEAARREYCRQCINEFQKLGYLDSYLEEVFDRKQRLMSQFTSSTTPRNDYD